MIDLLKVIKPYFSEESKNGSHGYDHAIRVYNIGKYISEREGGDLEIVGAGCLLHDIGKDYDRGGVCHAEFGSKMSKEILKSIGFPENKILSVSYCVKVHRYSKGINPETLEAKIVQDADRLEEIGAVAIARGLIEDKLRRKPLYDPSISPNEEYKSGENRTSINFLIEKSLKLKPQTFHTKTAQELSKRRYEFTQQFVKEVIDEWKVQI